MTKLPLSDVLFVEAGGVIEYDRDGNRFTYSHECDPDTFVELIVRECIKIIDNRYCIESEGVGLPAIHKASALNAIQVEILTKFGLTPH